MLNNNINRLNSSVKQDTSRVDASTIQLQSMNTLNGKGSDS